MLDYTSRFQRIGIDRLYKRIYSKVAIFAIIACSLMGTATAFIHYATAQIDASSAIAEVRYQNIRH